MGRKIGDLIQYTTQVVAALAVAFYLCWELTVVLLAAIPIIGMAGAYMIRAINASTHESFTQYAQAGRQLFTSISKVLPLLMSMHVYAAVYRGCCTGKHQRRAHCERLQPTARLRGQVPRLHPGGHARGHRQGHARGSWQWRGLRRRLSYLRARLLVRRQVGG
ncbi:hypothetical protein EON64_00330 [archaeon]|nr:MAG: hypothetical protein EON64_00330 [archaeon]